MLFFICRARYAKWHGRKVSLSWGLLRRNKECWGNDGRVALGPPGERLLFLGFITLVERGIEVVSFLFYAQDV